MNDPIGPVLIACEEGGVPEASAIRRGVSKLLHAADVRQPPVALRKVAAVQGIQEILSADLGTIDGCLVEERGALVAKLNRLAPSYRRRYSLAHEIAHTLLGDTPASRWGADHAAVFGKGRSARERACDAIAAELLLPYDLFCPRCEALGPSLPTVKRLADQFGASISATAIRMAEVTTDPVIVARWTPVGPPEWLSLEWSTRSSAARGCYIPRGSAPPPGSSPIEALKGIGLVTRLDRFGGHHGQAHYIESQRFGSGRTAFVLSIVHLSSASKEANRSSSAR
jgi:hypothetical protein